jgi:hypothetical protein
MRNTCLQRFVGSFGRLFWLAKRYYFQFISAAMHNEAAIVTPLFPRISSKKRCTFISAIIGHKGAAYTD